MPLTREQLQAILPEWKELQRLEAAGQLQLSERGQALYAQLAPEFARWVNPKGELYLTPRHEGDLISRQEKRPKPPPAVTTPLEGNTRSPKGMGVGEALLSDDPKDLTYREAVFGNNANDPSMGEVLGAEARGWIDTLVPAAGEIRQAMDKTQPKGVRRKAALSAATNVLLPGIGALRPDRQVEEFKSQKEGMEQQFARADKDFANDPVRRGVVKFAAAHPMFGGTVADIMYPSLVAPKGPPKKEERLAAAEGTSTLGSLAVGGTKGINTTPEGRPSFRKPTPERVQKAGERTTKKLHETIPDMINRRLGYYMDRDKLKAKHEMQRAQGLPTTGETSLDQFGGDFPDVPTVNTAKKVNLKATDAKIAERDKAAPAPFEEIDIINAAIRDIASKSKGELETVNNPSRELIDILDRAAEGKKLTQQDYELLRDMREPAPPAEGEAPVKAPKMPKALRETINFLERAREKYGTLNLTRAQVQALKQDRYGQIPDGAFKPGADAAVVSRAEKLKQQAKGLRRLLVEDTIDPVTGKSEVAELMNEYGNLERLREVAQALKTDSEIGAPISGTTMANTSGGVKKAAILGGTAVVGEFAGQALTGMPGLGATVALGIPAAALLSKGSRYSLTSPVIWQKLAALRRASTAAPPPGYQPPPPAYGQGKGKTPPPTSPVAPPPATGPSTPPPTTPTAPNPHGADFLASVGNNPRGGVGSKTAIQDEISYVVSKLNKATDPAEYDGYVARYDALKQAHDAVGTNVAAQPASVPASNTQTAGNIPTAQNKPAPAPAPPPGPTKAELQSVLNQMRELRRTPTAAKEAILADLWDRHGEALKKSGLMKPKDDRIRANAESFRAVEAGKKAKADELVAKRNKEKGEREAKREKDRLERERVAATKAAAKPPPPPPPGVDVPPPPPAVKVDPNSPEYKAAVEAGNPLGNKNAPTARTLTPEEKVAMEAETARKLAEQAKLTSKTPDVQRTDIAPDLQGLTPEQLKTKLKQFTKASELSETDLEATFEMLKTEAITEAKSKGAPPPNWIEHMKTDRARRAWLNKRIKDITSMEAETPPAVADPDPVATLLKTAFDTSEVETPKAAAPPPKAAPAPKPKKAKAAPYKPDAELEAAMRAAAAKGEGRKQ